ncbi:MULTISPECIES: Type 1 glutamine amidotransferase-like domain-containing protein [Paenibacillus]|jgi:dipeptidase E|uniref:Type 1 glutamine amidotransferase-like domain-containing protein n=1 Tax=Paenibacillus TaxID=44249 RepID=UPI000490387B|nr:MULTISPECIES: Type 1 glutamine amidotransferase-like domain-containing protein [Paenibacillus]MCP3747779.1 Type 1 glutamine amidotransferase-like domain-containing protein [Paenibacillus sp. A3M_27_13]OMF26691.1 peptidase S51 [Paenibacillus peoriae]SFR20797.1 dipeptidase E [Paenibacillus sp. cl130]
MKKLFLSSSFKDVAPCLVHFAGENLEGKKVTFIPTASIPEKVKFYVDSGKKALENLGLVVDEIEIGTATLNEIESKIRENDYIYITGGNTFYLLQELRRTGADKIIADEVNAGKLYIGESAGSMILSPNIEYARLMDNVEEAPALDSFIALGIIEFYPVPHHTNIPFKKAVESIIEEYGSQLNLYPISNAEVILVESDSIKVENA